MGVLFGPGRRDDAGREEKRVRSSMKLPVSRFEGVRGSSRVTDTS